MNKNIEKAIFKPRARVLQHLGDQLIGTPRLAIFELVKNAYDADATRVVVTVNGLGTTPRSISIEDDGVGMSLQTIRDIWLVIAHDHRHQQQKFHKRTPKGRLPLGSKGLGRLSVHKLGNIIEMITRAARAPEVVVRIDWSSLISQEYLDEAAFDIELRSPIKFLGDSTGTFIRISDLREKNWTRGEIRRLYRQITSISTPFGSQHRDDFSAILKVPDAPAWIENLPDPAEILRRAPWYYNFRFDGTKFSYNYSFRRIRNILREPRDVVAENAPLLLPSREVEDSSPLYYRLDSFATMQRVIADEEMLKGIGPISGELFVFDFTPKLTREIGEIRFLKDFLAENGGVRIYRDGIRVYDYGERSNDWLGLDLQRLNKLARGLSRNIVVGHVLLSQDSSYELVEKSNREGFIENAAYERLQRIVLGAIEPLVQERERDRKEILKLLGDVKDPEAKSIIEPVKKIRKIAKQHNLSDQINKLLDRIEHEYVSMKERLLSAGVSGTSLALVFHELEQGLHGLYKNLESSRESTNVAIQVRELMRLLDGFSDLFRSKARKPVKLRSLVSRACDLSKIRFRYHDVLLECPALERKGSDPTVSCSFGLTLGVLMNIIDNAIYWMRTRWPEGRRKSGRAIFVDIDTDFEERPTIVIADTGPGFQDSPDELIRPFYSRRPEGMGLGLYYASMVMELNDGELLFPDRSEFDIHQKYDGAIVALRFQKLERSLA